MGISNNFQLSTKTEINAYKAFRNTTLQQEVRLFARKEWAPSSLIVVPHLFPTPDTYCLLQSFTRYWVPTSSILVLDFSNDAIQWFPFVISAHRPCNTAICVSAAVEILPQSNSQYYHRSPLPTKILFVQKTWTHTQRFWLSNSALWLYIIYLHYPVRASRLCYWING